MTADFTKWLDRIKDTRVKMRIVARIDRLADGQFGDFKPIASGISELRIHSGPGYRIYFTIRNHRLIILLAGGNKQNQLRDISRAVRLARTI